jgi:hypothetical protein
MSFSLSPDHLLDRVENAGMAHQFVEPSQKQMRLVAKSPLNPLLAASKASRRLRRSAASPSDTARIGA